MSFVNVAENLETIQANIRQACDRAGRSNNEISVIAVTKYVTIDRAKQAIEAGVEHLGENRVEGMNEKYDEIGQGVQWHFIGTLQSRKVKEVIDQVSMIHSLDRKSLAKEINKRTDRKVPCFVQVNVSGEDSKHGLEPEEVIPFIDSLRNYENIEVTGLMTMAPYIEDQDKLRSIFRKLRTIKEEVETKDWAHAPCKHLSMGMSNDYEIAIEEGATHIRIGSKLVGKEF
ncbi:YggS family pyridoxal phosphate-dependent enzyme [Pontibacillus sp. HMF3514]|nr:YggS family pyridoxal phosphate-dependent enzyme [Pontibacillus sp. HMF3514]